MYPNLKHRKAERIGAPLLSLLLTLASAGVAASTTAMETTTVESASTKASPHASRSNRRPRVEGSTRRARSGVNAVCVSAAGCVVLTRPPCANIGRVKRVIEVSPEERCAEDQTRRIESPAKWAVEDPSPRHECIS